MTEPGDAREGEPEYRSGVANDGGDDHRGVHEYVGKIDLVDPAQKVDDDGTGRRLAGRLVLAEEAVGQKHAKARAWVRLKEEHE